VNPNSSVTYPFNDWLTYTIHFQNTGTSSAINIVVKDSLDSGLDPTTFRLLSYSHPINVNITGSNVSFGFPNIHLPDSNSNEALSHGLIQYKIKPNGILPAGTIFSNKADIYFDYNLPITTNTTYTPIGFVGIETELDLFLNIYPNPAKDYIQIAFAKPGTERIIELNDLAGRKLITQVTAEQNTTLSLHTYPAGIYILVVHEGGKTISKKIIVTH
jgi:uncharacterized repeat protein (TIGR01451 family)